MPDQDTPDDIPNRPRELMALDWEDVKGAAQAAFNVWQAGGEMQWAKEVWERTSLPVLPTIQTR